MWVWIETPASFAYGAKPELSNTFKNASEPSCRMGQKTPASGSSCCLPGVTKFQTRLGSHGKVSKSFKHHLLVLRLPRHLFRTTFVWVLLLFQKWI
jgi:hypothetical protein